MGLAFMSKYLWQHSIAATVGLAIICTTFGSPISTSAQGGTADPTPKPTTTAPTMKPSTPKKTPATGTGSTEASPSPTSSPVTGNEAKPAKTPTTTTKPVKKRNTIVDVAVKNKSLKTLVAAVKAADLVDTLSGKGPFTVFAPADSAFAALPKGTLKDLLKPENQEKLKKILTYHVIPGAVMSNAIKPGKVETVEGSTIALTVRGKTVRVNKAKVLKANIKAGNGVIHIIDTVLLPPDQ
jgi:uncharacterized surface protein with fasciclin (FAS1) repeats